jgi:hypothetical protein
MFTWRNYELMEIVITEFHEILEMVHEDQKKMSRVELLDLILRLRALSDVVVASLHEGTPEET